MGKIPFSPELKPFSITQCNCTAIGSCSTFKNKPMARQRCCTNLWPRSLPKPARIGVAIWLYKRPLCHRIQISSPSAATTFFVDLRWLKSLLAVDTPCSGTAIFCSADSPHFPLPSAPHSCGPASPAAIRRALSEQISKEKIFAALL